MLMRPAVRTAAPLLLACASATAGCDGDRARDPAYARGPTVVMAVTDVDAVKPDNWDLDFLTFLPLAKQNARGELEGELARSWEHSPDHHEYTYHLRTGVRWDDGEPVTAHDVKFTLDLLAHPDVAQYSDIAATVVDDSTVRIRAPNPGYIADISYFPRHLLAGLEPKRFWQWDFWTRPVGNGPFRFVRYVPNTMLELESNPRYFAGRPKIQRVILKFVGEAGLTELLAGRVDIARANLTHAPRIARDPRFRVYSRGSPAARAIYWRTDHQLFADARVRRALTLAIDRPQLLQLLNLPVELPITDGIHTLPQFRRREWAQPLPYDPAGARTLLEAAGWTDADGDGVREKHGRPFRFTAVVRNDPALPQLAVATQQFFRAVGVRMEIQQVEDGMAWERLRSGDFEAWFGVAQTFVGAQQRDFGRGNKLGYRNAHAFDVIDRLAATGNPEEQDRLYRQLSDIYVADMPFTRLVPYTRDWFAHRRVRGLSTPFQADPDTYMERLWVEEDR